MDEWIDGTATGDYARLILAPDRQQFYAAYRRRSATTDDRRSSYHKPPTFDVAFGRSMLFGNGLSACFADGDLGRDRRAISSSARSSSRPASARGWLARAGYFGGRSGLMLIEVAVLQRFVMRWAIQSSPYRHAFSRLLGTGVGAR